MPTCAAQAVHVGILSRLSSLFDYDPSTGFQEYLGYASPWAFDSTLAAIIPPTGPGEAVTADAAMRVPPVTRAVAMLSTSAAGVELAAKSGAVPDWWHRSPGPTGPALRLVQLVQDLVFYARALLLVERRDGEIVDAVRLAPTAWQVNSEGIPTINGEPLPAASYVYFPSLLPSGFLSYGAQSVQHYRRLVETINDRANNPVPIVELHITEQFDGTEEELTQAQADWSKARNSPNGAVAFTPPGIDLKTPGMGAATDWLLDARNAVRLDVANYLNIPAALLEGNNGASDTYSNTLQNTNEFAVFSLPTWLLPIAQRLSQDDVTPEGTVLHFPLDQFDTPAPAASAGNIGTAVAPTAPQEETA